MLPGTTVHSRSCLSENAHKFQYTHYQFLVSGVLSILLFLYCFSLPACPIVKKETKSWVETWGFDAFKLFKSREMAMFFIFSCMLGMSLQVTNGYATPFITSFKGNPAMLDTLQLTMLRSWYPSLRWPRRSASFSFRSS